MSFKVYINQGEWDQICDWVLKHEEIETGGDLFGLWLDEQTAVVQFVLGPGEECSRTTTSFFQDLDYLHEAGTYLTKDHGLCNVGQWHSHHKINLFKPSVGDENTVWSNMPNLGLDRYIVFIANIPNQVKINCFLFQIKKGKQLSVKHGEFEFLDGNSPLRLNEKVLKNVHSGAESFNQITRLEKEMKYIRNKDEKENLDISNKNEREKTKNRYTQENTGTTEKQDKNKPKQKLSVSVYHIPTPERHSLKQPGFTDNNYTGVARIVKDTQKQWEHSATTPTTSDQGSKIYNYPTTPREKQKQWDLKETTPKSSESGKLANASQKERKQDIDKVGNKHQYPNTRRTTEGAQQLQSASVRFKGTDSQAMNVPVNQPRGFGGSGSLKKKSGDDDVKGDIELPQHKNSRPNSQDKPEVIHKRSSTPSGTFTLAEEGHQKIKQTGEINDKKTTRSSWNRLCNGMCCMCCGISKSITDEPEVEEIRLNKVEDNDGTKVLH